MYIRVAFLFSDFAISRSINVPYVIVRSEKPRGSREPPMGRHHSTVIDDLWSMKLVY